MPDILNAITELNRSSHCIVVNSDYFAVLTESNVMMLWAKSRA